MTPKFYLFTDTETGSLKENGALLQLAGIIVEESIHPIEPICEYEVKEEFNFFIQPFPDDLVEDAALEINHIKREDFPTFLTPREAYLKLLALLGKYVNKFDSKDKMFFVGYNSPFDSEFIRRFFIKNNDNYFGSWFWTPDLCVMREAAKVLRHQRDLLPNFKQGTVAEFLNITVDGELHDALTDIKVTLEIFKKIINQ